jgi:hypothetical protein
MKPKNKLHQAMADSMEVRLLPLKRFATGATLVLLLWSASLETAFFYAGFKQMLSSNLAAIVIALVLALLLESLKYFSGTFAFRFLVRRWLGDGWHYVLAFMVVLPLCIASFVGSIFLSIRGAPLVASFYSEQGSQLNLVNLDSINIYFDARQKQLTKEKEAAIQIKKRGRTTSQATLWLTQIQSQSNSIEVQRDTALTQAKRVNNLLLANKKGASKNWGTWLSRFGGYGEMLTLFFLFFVEVFNSAKLPVSPRQASTIVKSDKRGKRKRQVSSLRHPPDFVNDKLVYNGREYPLPRFLDWLKKVEQRASESATESARRRNQARHSEMSATLESQLKRGSPVSY